MAKEDANQAGEAAAAGDGAGASASAGSDGGGQQQQAQGQQQGQGIEQPDVEADFRQSLQEVSAAESDGAGVAKAGEAQGQQTPEQKAAADAAAKQQTGQGQQQQQQAPQFTPQQLQAYSEQLQAKEQEVLRVHQDVSAVLSDPDFQQAYRQVQAQRQQQQPPQGQGQQANAQMQQQIPDTAKIIESLDRFQPETENERTIGGVAKQLAQIVNGLQERFGQQFEQLGQRFDQFGQKIGKYEEQAQQEVLRQADSHIDQSLAKVKERFPDLCDGKQRESDLMQQASQFIYANKLMHRANPAIQLVTLDQALEQAAMLLSFPDLEKRARGQVEAQARRAADTQLETPAAEQGQQIPEGDIEDMMRRAYRSAS